MAEYKVQLTNYAAKQLDKLEDNLADKLLSEIEKLKSNPRPQNCKT